MSSESVMDYEMMAAGSSDALRVVTAHGDSMRGAFAAGDPVQVDTLLRCFIGDAVYPLRWNGCVQIKRLQLSAPT